MAIAVLKGGRVIYDHYDLSPYIKSVSLQLGSKDLDVTSLSSNTSLSAAGLITARMVLNGFVDSNNLNTWMDVMRFDNLSTMNQLFSLYPLGDAAGSRGFGIKTSTAKVDNKAEIGDLIVFDVNSVCSSESAIQLTSMVTPSYVSTSGVSTGIQLGAVPVGQKLYSFLHTFPANGTLTVEVQSCATQVGTYVTRITHAASAIDQSEYKELAGPVTTDTWWRISWTITGSTTFRIGVGIK